MNRRVVLLVANHGRGGWWRCWLRGGTRRWRGSRPRAGDMDQIGIRIFRGVLFDRLQIQVASIEQPGAVATDRELRLPVVAVQRPAAVMRPANDPRPVKLHLQQLVRIRYPSG